MRFITFICAHCGERGSQPSGAVNRARNIKAPLYCGRVCHGLARRKHKTKAQLVAEKRAYDKRYRAKNLAAIKAKKAAHFQRTYDPVRAAVERKARMPRHVEYCRQPAYKAWKREYDRRYRAKEFDDYAECFLLLQDLETEIASRMTKYEIMLANGTICKAQKRRRAYESLRQG